MTQEAETFKIMTERGWIELFLVWEAFNIVSGAIFALETESPVSAQRWYNKTTEAGIVWG